MSREPRNTMQRCRKCNAPVRQVWPRTTATVGGVSTGGLVTIDFEATGGGEVECVEGTWIWSRTKGDGTHRLHRCPEARP